MFGDLHAASLTSSDPNEIFVEPVRSASFLVRVLYPLDTARFPRDLDVDISQRSGASCAFRSGMSSVQQKIRDGLLETEQERPTTKRLRQSLIAS